MLREAFKDAKNKYELPDDNVIDMVLNPALANAKTFDCLSGYFNATALADLAHGLADYIHNSDKPFRLLISPSLSSDDQLAVSKSFEEDEVFNEIEALISSSVGNAYQALVDHTRLCLAYLLKLGRLQLKVVLLKDGGIFHPKLWLFGDGVERVSFEGSANITHAGLNENIERMTLQCSWRGQGDEVQRDFEYFEEFWNNKKANSVTISAGDASLHRLFRDANSTTPPTREDYLRALAAVSPVFKPEETSEESFTVPPSVVWQSGDFKHQGEAVSAWERDGRRGILEMATGSGKTITSLIAAQRLYAEKQKLLIVIAAPTVVLTAQWVGDCREFGLNPYLCDSAKRHTEHIAVIQRKLLSLELGVSDVEAVIITHELAKNDSLARVLSDSEIPVLFIGDEVHRLGLTSFLDNPPVVGFRLGLSATPNRQYDDIGNQGLKEYFGEVVFRFDIEAAIGVCLVPYNYSVDVVRLSSDELLVWQEWQGKIAKFLSTCGEKLSRLEQKQLTVLAKQQRAVIESAIGKVPALRARLRQMEIPAIRHALIYCTSSNPKQMEDVNQLLNDLGIRFHRVTQEETPNPRVMKDILSRFEDGSNQVLTAKKVLDEGFNVPMIAQAYVLASSTSEREWVQRRGRVLRKSAGKSHAEIIDYLVLPPRDALSEQETIQFARGDLRRLWEFGRLAMNIDQADGIEATIRALRMELPNLEWPPTGNGSAAQISIDEDDFGSDGSLPDAGSESDTLYSGGKTWQET